SHTVGTNIDQTNQTQQAGLKQYTVDARDGVYDSNLHLSEFDTVEEAEVLAYNLASEDELNREGGPEKPHERIFSVSVNGTVLFQDLNLAEDFEPLRAVSRKARVNVTGGVGIVIDFEVVAGESVLNGLEVKRIF